MIHRVVDAEETVVGVLEKPSILYYYVWFSKSFVFLQCLYPCAGVDDNRDFVPGVPINNG